MAADTASPAEAAAQLRADLALLEASTREAAQLLDLAAWRLGELDRGSAPLTSKTRTLTRAKESISAAKARSEEVLEHLDASRRVRWGPWVPSQSLFFIAHAAMRPHSFGLSLVVLRSHRVLTLAPHPHPHPHPSPTPHPPPTHPPPPPPPSSCAQLQGIIQAGPRAGLEAFLAALSRLEAAVDFLQAHRSMQSAEDALRHTAALRDAALSACSQEFSSLANKHSAAAPAAALARARATASSGDAGRAAPGVSIAQQDAVPPLELLPGSVLEKLRELAGAMLRGGSASASGRAAIKAYVEARQAVLRSELDTLLSGLTAAAAAASGGGSTGTAAAGSQLSWQSIEAKLPGCGSRAHPLVKQPSCVVLRRLCNPPPVV